MRIRTDLNKLNDTDIYSLLLFTLYKLVDVPEYSAVSELIYVLDRPNFLKLCEYFGGVTITIPTISQLKTLTQALLLYQYVVIDNLEYDVAIEKLSPEIEDMKELKTCYNKIADVLANYKFSVRKHL